MKLGGEALLEQFHTGNWRAYRNNDLIEFEELRNLIGPNSIDVTLHKTVLLPAQNQEGENTPLVSLGNEDPKQRVVDPHNPDALKWISGDIEEKGFAMQPGGFILAAVQERFVCSAPVIINGEKTFFAPMYEGRSTCARLGLESHLSAGFGDYGFGGSFVLECVLHLPLPLLLRHGMRIGQVAFEEVYRPKMYRGAYSEENHYDGPVPPKLGIDRF
jgi:dCTP deaminase